MPETTANKHVKVDFKPGPATPKQRAAWQKLWQKLLNEPKSEAVK